MENSTFGVSAPTANYSDIPQNYLDIFNHLAPQISIIDRVISPIFYVIGLIANPITTKIWLSRKMRKNNSSAIYVGVLSIVHTIFLLLHIVQELNFAWGVTSYTRMSVMCEVFNMAIYVPQYYAPLLVLAFTVERYIAVNHPFVKERFCTVKRAIYVSIGLLIFSLQIASLQTYIWQFHPSEGTCYPSEDVEQFEKIWTLTTELTLFMFVPVCVLVVNILVIREIRRITYQSALPQQTRGCGGQTSTITLLSVSFYLICTLLPASIVFALQGVIKPGQVADMDTMASDPMWKRYLRYMTIRKVVEEICMSNYSCYFFIYYITGEIFRREVRKLCCWRLFKSKKDKNTVSSKTEYTLVTTDNTHIKPEKANYTATNNSEYTLVATDNTKKYESSTAI
ncbi:ovarian cancer G-protein coupled receptor 1-like [Saccostrea echinata]|uniref:ovarian cancer G-protein coupled receptor 1-like n=1 Tax=Saccostrea echinata TaxID=191078 RepID=UPI002A8193AF|nr:ovarian cancer G-protein coupled receptor 1-like [Saccostrea echinata]XP_061183927.1 ovarian cancer G-protein coupled receptor 1-like [Saccostrea echinata]XP_061183928.1 ovarian cancer G-protein coupled receptor 1-like [Saccostrea echinata]XP_061183929.1 ovarian cancer G-protein coupled receptor 1-like [Saccostrea echinata]